jgi:hypothetical protein
VARVGEQPRWEARDGLPVGPAIPASGTGIMSPMWARVSWLTLPGAVIGCSPAAFVCAEDAQCGDEGVCETSGFCSFPDPSCPSGRRYGKHAGSSSNECVGAEDDTTDDGVAHTMGTSGGSESGPGHTTASDSDPSTSSSGDPSTSDESTSARDDCAWSYERTVTIDGNLSEELLTNFPVLVRWPGGDLGDVAFADGRDIRFLADDGGSLSHEIELFEPETETLVAWVRVPALEPGASTSLRMQWGNAGSSGQEDPQGVWDEDFLGVWHMNTPPGQEGSIRDSSGHAHHGTPEGAMTEDDLIPGVVGLALDLDGDDDSITIPNRFKASLTQYTLSAWANITANQDNAIFWRLNGDFLYPRGDVLANGSYRMQLRIDGAVDLIFAPPVAAGIHHFVFVYSMSQGTDSELWLDGELVASKSLAGSVLAQGAHDLAFGVDTDLGGRLEGVLDEVRLSNVVRSHGWILATYRIQAHTSEYVTFGPVEEARGC